MESNNLVTIAGEILNNPTFNHEMCGEKFYIADLKVLRTSGISDIIPIMISDRLISIQCLTSGNLISVAGQFRSYNNHEEHRNRLVLSVFAKEIDFVDEIEESSKTNQIYLDGYICKEPVYRKTPLGREITGLLLAVNRPYGKSDYIPCICWGRNARYANDFKLGKRCAVWGRVQSREYLKKLSETESEKRIAYEVSVSRLEEEDAD